VHISVSGYSNHAHWDIFRLRNMFNHQKFDAINRDM